MLEIKILGKTPSKKNQLVRRKDGKGYFNPKGKEIADIVSQIKKQVGDIIPFDKPMVSMLFVCSRANTDIDNKATTIMDCLVKAGVLINDNLKHFTGPLTVTGKKGDYDGALIQIVPSEA